MLMTVVDTETTGMGDQDQVCEVAACRVSWSPEPDAAIGVVPWTTLIQPTCPVTIGARATHHITDRELARAKKMEEVRDDVVEALGGPSAILVAHNAEFDLRLLLQSGIPRDELPSRVICTYRCALHVYPDAPGHSNQVLRYYLGIEPRFTTKLPPHRALPDVEVTTPLLLKMLEEKTPDELVEMTTQPVLQRVCRFGKNAGKLWSEIPSSDLEWILSRGPRRSNPAGGYDLGFDADVRHTAMHYLRKLSPRSGQLL